MSAWRTVPAVGIGSGIPAANGAPDAAMPDTPRRARERPIRLLVFTSLYPNAVQVRHGVFVEERLRHLIDAGGVTATVVAPVPWFPFTHPRFGRYAAFARVPQEETRHGIRILHPRYPVIPKLGMHLAPTLLERAAWPTVRRLCADPAAFDLIDAHYLYPDGVAAVGMAQRLGKPAVLTARGSDVTTIPHDHFARHHLLRAAKRAARVVTVSDALHQRLVALGADPAKLVTLRNGVDLDRFRPLECSALRARLGVQGTVWLTVGHLIELKGVHVALEALAREPDATLLVVGEGPEEGALRALAGRLAVAERVRFVGTVPHDALRDYYNAADALLHPSSHEGMPNVVLEALACGTPVVAAPFDGVDELLGAPEAGAIASERSGEAIAAAWQHLRQRAVPRATTRAFAERFGWAPVVTAQCALYAQVLDARASRETRNGA